MILFLMVVCLTQALMEEDPNSVPRLGKRMDGPLNSFGEAASLGFRYVQVPGQFYKREYLMPSPSGFEKRARDLTSSLNGVPMIGKRGSDGFPPYNIDIRYEE